jgi:hypothetical protein
VFFAPFVSLVLFVSFVLLCAAGVAVYVATRSRPPGAGVVPTGASDDAPLAGREAAVARLRRGPFVYYRSMRGAEFGRVVIASLANPDEDRVVSALSCERVSMGRARGVCLVDNRAHVQPPGFARVVDRDLRTQAVIPLAGLPIRARVSRDERYAAATVFVTGESYASDFTTRTTLIDLARGASVADLESFVVIRDGQRFRAVDFNFWGVSFSGDANVFFATLGTGGHRYLVKGNVERRQVDVLRDGVECPSLSPDERHIAFKSPVAGTREWRLHVMDVATLRDWPIDGEARNLDDQVEWLDNDHVLYQTIEARGLPEDAVNVWQSATAEATTAAPVRFARSAWSISVVR